MNQILLYHQERFIPEKSILLIQNKEFYESDLFISPRMIHSRKKHLTDTELRIFMIQIFVISPRMIKFRIQSLY